MGSYNAGKVEVISFIVSNFKQNDTCLDVGACDGKWSELLGNFLIKDAVEVFTPNIDKHHLEKKYRQVFNTDIVNFQYDWYDIIIFGDVLEHMSIDQAQAVVEYAKPRCKDMIIAVPYLYEQGALYGNPYEVHIQDDLTPEIFEQRYPGFERIWWNNEYAYYHKK